MRHFFFPCILSAGLLAVSCAGPNLSRYADFYRNEPRTILVLPVQNLSTDAEAPRFFLSTISKPLIGRGFYIYPPHLVAEMIAAEGIDLAGESWEIPPDRLLKYLGADAVLYIRITHWETAYLVLSSSVTVGLHYKLVSTRTGRVLWDYKGRRVIKSGGRSDGSLGSLIGQAISAAVTALSTDYVPIARQLNRDVLVSLPPGAYHPKHDEFRRKVLGEGTTSN